MAKEQVAARLQRVKEALHEFAFTLFRKIDENIHAENQVHLADVDGIGKIHLDEINHFANSWPYLMCASNRREMCRELPFAYACDVVIQPGETGGYQIFVTVNRYLEDLPRPIRATAGAAAFRSDNTVDRRFEVVDPNRPEAGWIPKGREPYLEQSLLRQIEDRLNNRRP